VQNSSPPPSKNGPTLIDVDCTCGKGSLTVACFRCRQTGNYARECPQAFDICLVTTAEKLELLPEFFTLVDVGRDPTEENHSKDVEYRVMEAEQVEDFVTCS
jgi:hypothetical protein